MLKRSAAILLVVLYTITASGFALNLHYCFNRLASVQINAPAKSCVSGLEGRKMACCKDKHIEVKVKDAHQSASWFFSGKIFIGLSPKPEIPDFKTIIKAVFLPQLAYRGPPLLLPVSAYLVYRNIRI